MKKYLFGIIGVLIVASILLSGLGIGMPNPAPVYADGGSTDVITLVPLDKQPKSPQVLKVLQDKGIDKNYVKLEKDYGRKSDGLSPYSQTWVDQKSGLRVMEVSQLPMVNADGQKVDTTWYTSDGKNFTAGINQFIASVATNKVTVIAINDQPDGKTKKDHVLTYQPQLYLGVKEIKPLSTPTLLAVDPLNENYASNTLVWDYGIAKRYLRLIEGSLQGSWVFATDPGDFIRIVYNQTPDYTLRLGQFATDADTEIVPASVFVSAEYPFTVADSATYYPDANPETTTVDGVVYQTYASASGVSWATIIAAAGTGFGDTATTLYPTYIRADGAGYNDKWRYLYKGIILLDISGLPPNAENFAATFSLYGNAKADTLGITPDVNIYSSAPASNTALAAGDFDSLGSTPFSTAISYADWLISTTSPYWNNFVLNAAGLAALQTAYEGDGILKLGARNANYDVSGTPPTWTAGGQSYLIAYSADQGAGYKPKLVVTYTVPPTVTTQAATVTSNTTATGNGNVTSIGSSNVTIRGIQWGTATSTYTTNVTDAGNWGVGGAFTESLTGLPPGTTIYARAEAYNSDGWGYGAEVTFTTFGPPTVTTQAASAIGTIVATFNGNITSLGGDVSSTDRGFVYDTVTHGDPGGNTPAASGYAFDLTEAGIFVTGTFDGDATGLTQVETYFVRAYAKNTYGYSYGTEITFTTRGQILWFEPNTIISGTTLPNRTGGGNGVITWGANPTGVGVSLGSMTSSGQSDIGVVSDTSTGDILPTVGGTDWRPDTGISASLQANPMRPIVTAISDNTTLSEYQVWVWFGIILVIFVTVLVGANVRGHHLITGIAMTVAIILLVVWTIFPWGTLFIAALAVILGLVSERSPSL